MSFWNEKKAKKKKLFQKLPFYNLLIEKPKIKHLSNIELLHKLPFYDKLDVVEILKRFKECPRSYKIEIIDLKDPLVQLKASKSSTEDLFKDLLYEMKGFIHQITIKFCYANTKEIRRQRICSCLFLH